MRKCAGSSEDERKQTVEAGGSLFKFTKMGHTSETACLTSTILTAALTTKQSRWSARCSLNMVQLLKPGQAVTRHLCLWKIQSKYRRETSPPSFVAADLQQSPQRFLGHQSHLTAPARPLAWAS